MLQKPTPKVISVSNVETYPKNCFCCKFGRNLSRRLFLSHMLQKCIRKVASVEKVVETYRYSCFWCKFIKTYPEGCFSCKFCRNLLQNSYLLQMLYKLTLEVVSAAKVVETYHKDCICWNIFAETYPEGCFCFKCYRNLSWRLILLQML